jgi:protein TonB
MEVKKDPKVDLENYKLLFFLIGLVLSLAIVLVLFDWKTRTKQVKMFAMQQKTDIEQEQVPVTRQDIKMPPPPPPKQTVSNVIDIVSNKAKIDVDFSINVEATENQKISFTDIPINTNVNSDDEDNKIFVSVQQMPQFPGGIMALRQWIAEHIQYPVLAQENDIEGTVIVKFVVGKHGEVTNVTVLRGVDPLLDSEAVRVVKHLPRFKPGYNNGRPVRVWYTLPIVFKLQKD